MQLGFLVDLHLCMGCKGCEIACKVENEVPLSSWRLRVKYLDVGVFPTTTRNFTPLRCNHCENAPCERVCPVSALHYLDNGIVNIDNERCIGCAGSIMACPYGAIYTDERANVADKCTFCYDTRIVNGETTTACQATCPTKVRLFGDIDDEESDLIKLLKERKFYVLKEGEGTIPKLFYLLPEHDDYFAMNSVSPDTNIYTWDEYKPIIGKAKAKRGNQWKVARS